MNVSFIIANPPPHVRSFRRALLAWYRKHGRDLPWRRTRDPYAILVSEFMLQQTQVATVIPYYNRWLERFPNFASLARASESDVLRTWEGLGYYARARNLHATAKMVVAQQRGVLPRRADEIRQLPGLGRYSANAVATFAFDAPVPIVEANIGRLLARLGNVKTPVDSTRGRAQIWNLAADLLQERGAGLYNSALLDLGALICVARQPKCQICPVKEWCYATEPATLPIKRKQPASVRVREFHGFTFQRSRVLLEQSQSRWRGMWILPPLDSAPKMQSAIHESEFPFTNHRIALVVYPQPAKQGAGKALQRWFSIKQLQSIPMPSPHRRALDAIVEQHLVPSSKLA